MPQLTLRSLLYDILHGIHALIYSPDTRVFALVTVTLATSIMTKLIIARVPYTEIDFSTYMQQIQLIEEGERDYSKVTGDTGPIVYPAGYVSVYSFIRWITQEGSDVPTAQSLFGYLMVFTNFLAMCSYMLVDGLAPWPMYGLVLSKRLFSIYVLRLFNDCFTTLGTIATVLLLQVGASQYWSSPGVTWALCVVAADVYSLALSVKMNALLYLPGFIVVVYFLVGENLLKLASVLAVIPLVQVAVGWHFLVPMFGGEEAQYIRWTYLRQAFDFSRQFLFKWTVNWRFVGEDIFTSPSFATALFSLHLGTLVFFGVTRYISPKVTGKSIPQLVLDSLRLSKGPSKNNLYLGEKGPKTVLFTMATSNLIGVLFARSLHYQFLSWYCWHLPVLLSWTGLPVPVALLVWVAHEVCWNVYPSTAWSSAMLVGILTGVLVLVWRNGDKKEKEKEE